MRRHCRLTCGCPRKDLAAVLAEKSGDRVGAQRVRRSPDRVQTTRDALLRLLVELIESRNPDVIGRANRSAIAHRPLRSASGTRWTSRRPSRSTQRPSTDSHRKSPAEETPAGLFVSCRTICVIPGQSCRPRSQKRQSHNFSVFVGFLLTTQCAGAKGRVNSASLPSAAPPSQTCTDTKAGSQGSRLGAFRRSACTGQAHFIGA